MEERKERFEKMLKMMTVIFQANPMILTDEELETIKKELKRVSNEFKFYGIDRIDRIFDEQ